MIEGKLTRKIKDAAETLRSFFYVGEAGREEARSIEEGRADPVDNPLKRAPHTVHAVTAETWDRPYTREQAAFPARWTRDHKFWPAVARIDNAYGDRNLFCTCGPMEP